MQQVKFAGSIKGSDREKLISKLNQAFEDAHNLKEIFAGNQYKFLQSLDEDLGRAEHALNNINMFLAISDAERKNLGDDILTSELEKFENIINAFMTRIRDFIGTQYQSDKLAKTNKKK